MRWLNVPNALTLLRLLLAPAVIAAILGRRHGTALALFFLAACTDGLDGAAARRFGSITRVGAYLDPVADKILLSGVYAGLAVAGRIPFWLVALVFGRDLYILAGAGFLAAAAGFRNFPPSTWGKLSTLCQSAGVVIWLTRDSFPTPFLENLARVAVWPVAALTLWSGIHYSWIGWRLTRRRERESGVH